MQFTTRTGIDGHAGFVAGRYRDGAYSDAWTDVRRCADRTFTAYAPACSCGWRGTAQPASQVGLVQCRRSWLHEHAEPTADQSRRHPTSGTLVG